MTIERDWWPTGPAPIIDKFQANTLISLAVELDGVEPPKHLDVKLATRSANSASQSTLNYKIGKVNADTYRRYCSQLWDRSSDSVKFLYMISGMAYASSYLIRIVTGITKLKHASPEIRSDWDAVLVHITHAMEGIQAIKRKAAIDALLPKVDEVKAETLHTTNAGFAAAESMMPSEKSPIVLRMSTKGLDADEMVKRLEAYYKDNETLPEPNVRAATANTALADLHDVAGVILNPIYAGVPPYPAVISDPLWIHANRAMIEHQGANQYLVNLLFVLRETFTKHFLPATPDPMWSVEVMCATEVPREEWDHDDRRGNPVGEYTFTPRAKNEAEARESALDDFHSTVPIANLETFVVEARVLPRVQATEAESGPV